MDAGGEQQTRLGRVQVFACSILAILAARQRMSKGDKQQRG